MKLAIQLPQKALNQAYRKDPVDSESFEQFKTALGKLLSEIDEDEQEENIKNLMSDFLKDAFYKEEHHINTSSDIDLVIRHKNTQKSNVGVLIETKKPNSREMMTATDSNQKALQQLVYYYLIERIENKNTEIKQLIATDVYNWFIFDEVEFEKHLAQDKKFVKAFETFRREKKPTSFFYTEIAKPQLDKIGGNLTATFFDLRDYKKELGNSHQNGSRLGNLEQPNKTPTEKQKKRLISLYKVLSPVHLLKKPFANDSNSLNKDFYAELLHILGLEETKDKNKKVIQRKDKANRDNGSFLENTIAKLERKRVDKIEGYQNYGETEQERLEGIALELCITWTNRILFLKLLEAQLLQYHKGDKQYKFLNSEAVSSFDDLDDLFFGVLAKQPKDRSERLTANFANVPYLNSSLFEETDLEGNSITTGNLSDDTTIRIHSRSVLKDAQGKRSTGTETPLKYLFRFLDAYNFASEGTEEIHHDKKSLINASVLGLIFEKINGYKDGSFYTPSFITMYMCRETLRRAVVQKFSEHYEMDFDDFKHLKNFLSKRFRDAEILEDNQIINSLKVCDPAVGSGHFLVSALNELLAIKADLGLLANGKGEILKVGINIENDELFVSQGNEHDFFEYRIGDKESQNIQETLFHEKQVLIENCLFGVDINPNSVKICRLRLWIELLKNAYYKKGQSNQSFKVSKTLKDSSYTELETLPNIDINIKVGNSLISRFGLDADIKPALKKAKTTITKYRNAVQTYRNATSKEEKREMERLIEDIKTNFRSEISKNDKKVIDLNNAKGQLYNLQNQGGLFEPSKAEKKKQKALEKKLKADIEKLETQIEEIKSNKIYENAFEWRFEFPEVLDNKGEFVGFDVVIGNPPYMRVRNVTKAFMLFLKDSYNVAENQFDLYHLFLEQSVRISNTNSFISLIIPNAFLANENCFKLRTFLLDNLHINKIVDSREDIFEDASVDTLMILLSKAKSNESVYGEVINEKVEIYHSIEPHSFRNLPNNNFAVTLDKNALVLLQKCLSKSYLLENLYDVTSGIKEYQIGKGTPPQTADIVKNKNFNSNSKIDAEYLPEVRGRNLNNYFVSWENEYIKYGKWIAEPRNPLFFKGKRLLVRQIPAKNRLVVSYTDKDFIVDQTAYIAKPKLDADSPYKIETSLGLLNSKLMFWLFTNMNNEFDLLFPKIKTKELKNLPIPKDPNPTQSTQIEELVNEIIALKKANSKADTSEQEGQIDALVYQLYGLTEEEIEIVEGAVK